MSTSMMVGRSISIFSLLVITVRNMWFFCCLFCFSFLWLFCSMQSQSSPLSLIWKGLLLSEIFSTFTTSSPRPVAAPKYFISLYISFTFPYLLLKRHAWLSGNLGPVNSIHNFFFSWKFFDVQLILRKFVRERMVPSSFSSDILELNIKLQDPFY